MPALESLVELVKFRIGLNNDHGVIPALQLALSAFNMVPAITYFSLFDEDEENIAQISDILVTYASYILLTKKASEVLDN